MYAKLKMTIAEQLFTASGTCFPIRNLHLIADDEVSKLDRQKDSGDVVKQISGKL